MKRFARFYVIGAWLLALTILAACDAQRATSPSVPRDEPTATPTALDALRPSPRPGENSLRIAEPLPGTKITNSVTVRGEGRAFENTILVEVTADGKIIGQEIVTTQADIGEIGEFTVTLKLEPVQAPSQGQVTIYTTSAKDGSVDQSTSVPVKIAPPGAAP